MLRSDLRPPSRTGYQVAVLHGRFELAYITFVRAIVERVESRSTETRWTWYADSPDNLRAPVARAEESRTDDPAIGGIQTSQAPIEEIGFFDPASGRFTQEDPIGIGGGMNQYGFGGGDPVNFRDPFGLSCKDAQGKEVPCPDKVKVTKWLLDNAGETSTGKCATYCRQGLEAGGLDVSGHPRDARDYGPFLVSRGAEAVSNTNYEPQTGDIAVFGKNKAHPSGHIQVFDGQHWISDFKQKDANPYRDKDSAGTRTVYRFPDN